MYGQTVCLHCLWMLLVYGHKKYWDTFYFSIFALNPQTRQLCLPIVLFVRLAIATVTNHQQAALLKHWCGLMGDVRDLGTFDELSADISDQPYPLERSEFWLKFACFVFLFHIVKVISKLNLAFLVPRWLNRSEHFTSKLSAFIYSRGLAWIHEAQNSNLIQLPKCLQQTEEKNEPSYVFSASVKLTHPWKSHLRVRGVEDLRAHTHSLAHSKQ